MTADGSSTPTPASADRRSGASIVAVSAALSLAAGALTALAQGWLPERVGSLANSVGTWMLVAFALALPARRPRSAAVCSAVALVGLVVGYYATNQLRGVPSGTRAVLFWMFAAVVAGPLLGLAAHQLRRGSAVAAGVGVGLPAGILVGEGVYGLRSIADTTYPPYWRFEIACGLALLCLVGVTRLRRPAPLAAAGCTTVVVAAVFIALYSLDVPSLL